MYEFTEKIVIQAPPARVWEVMRDVEAWWPASNPEHESIERLDDGAEIEVGARFRIREKVAGIPGEAVGEITHIAPFSAVTWEAPRARYRWLGIPATVGEGVTWRIEPLGEGASELSAHVWATFPGILGPAREWVFTRMFGGVRKDREHAGIELRHLKRVIETGATPTSSQ